MKDNAKLTQRILEILDSGPRILRAPMTFAAVTECRRNPSWWKRDLKPLRERLGG